MNYKVIYTTKDAAGFLVEKTVEFKHMRSAIAFMRSLPNTSAIIGRPILERVA